MRFRATVKLDHYRKLALVDLGTVHVVNADGSNAQLEKLADFDLVPRQDVIPAVSD